MSPLIVQVVLLTERCVAFIVIGPSVARHYYFDALYVIRMLPVLYSKNFFK